MPQSLSLVIVHLAFSTKDRVPYLTKPITEELYPYLATICRNAGCECYRVGGMPDHVHLAVRLSRTATIAKLVEEIKTTSSKWLKSRSPHFAWQRGYGAFSVAVGDLEALIAYIDDQDKHHCRHTFQDELRTLLATFGIEYDERYIWD
jgi:REP element-mobilizing transposase RayT